MKNKDGRHISNSFLFAQIDTLKYRLENDLKRAKARKDKATDPRDKAASSGTYNGVLASIRRLENMENKIKFEFEREERLRGEDAGWLNKKVNRIVLSRKPKEENSTDCP